MTKKLYDDDSMLKKFGATVLSCEKSGENYEVILDKTAFFPESGGQSGDTGILGGAKVLDTIYKNEEIIHITDAPLDIGTTVTGELDFDLRYRKMQNHTGEHIVSAIVFRRFGYHNVGFHIGKDGVTFDFSGEISEDEIKEIEDEANKIVTQNLEVKTYYPSADELKTLAYRSKKELSGNVRIVEIVSCDRCACCAPHVKSTGEIGMIKILDFMRYKGGVRIFAKSGFDALDEFRAVLARESEISRLLCVPKNETASGVKAIKSAEAEQKYKMTALKNVIVQKYAENIVPTEKNICIFDTFLGAEELRALANLCVDKCRVVATLSGTDKDGYLFVCASKNVRLTAFRGKIAEKCKGKCGGSDLMLSGKLSASEAEITEFFEEETF